MKTDWEIVAIDETQYWHEDIVAKAGKLYGIYLFDASRHTYCCELTPSYEVYFIETVYTKATDDEDLNMKVLEADAQSGPTCYFHCRVIDRMRPKWTHAFPEHNVECATEEEWEEERESMLEYLRGNQYVPSGVTFNLEQT